MEDREDAYRYWLHNIPEMGEKAVTFLVEQYGTARILYNTPEKEIEKKLLEKGWRQKVVEKKMQAYRDFYSKWNVAERYEKMLEQGIRMVSIWDRAYPQRLRKLYSPPLILYYLGRLPTEGKSALAIIGARECSEYGAFAAKAFGQQAGRADVDVISGMARGIDGIGQKAAFLAGGSTYAVLGCGVDICYPISNKEIYYAVQETGGILSPFPPGTTPKKQLFPYRNSIVAGLSDAVLVVEARQKSGTWITVDMALEQGKDVYAVPGRLTDRLSDGCNLLIRQGAGIALSPEDIMTELAILKNRQADAAAPVRSEELRKKRHMEKTAQNRKRKEKKQGAEIGYKQEGAPDLLSFLDLTPKASDNILEEMKAAGIEMTLPQLLFEMIQLCMEGKAKQIGGNYFACSQNEYHIMLPE